MKSNDKSSWAVGGGLLCGLGVGLFYVKVNIFIFVGCILLGLGLGLFFAALLSRSCRCCCKDGQCCSCCEDGQCNCKKS